LGDDIASGKVFHIPESIQLIDIVIVANIKQRVFSKFIPLPPSKGEASDVWL
jgi:hypothetical protein